MEIRPVSLTQIVAGRDGRQYEVSGQAGRVAQLLTEVDPSLRVEFNEWGNFFVVIQTIPIGPRAGDEECVMRVQADDWDERVVRDFQLRNHELRHGISACDRLDAEEAAYKAERDYQLDQRTAEVANKLFHSLQREVVGITPRAFFPRAIPQAA